MNLRRPALARASLFALFALILVGCGGGAAPVSLPSADGGSGGAEVNAPPPLPPYTLGPGDEIRLTVFRHEDLSGEFQLDSEANFSMPLIGEVRALGLTARQTEDRIEGMLSPDYIRDPQVSVEVLTYRPFYILGEVNTPGQYEFVSGMTVQTAVALAGGYTERARRSVFLLQRGGSNAEVISVPADTAMAPGDILTIDERFF